MNKELRLIKLFKKHKAYFAHSISCSYPLTIEQIRKYKSQLIWKANDDNAFFYGQMSSNKSLPWAPDLLKEFEDRWDWCFISGNILGAKIDFEYVVVNYFDKIDWSSVSCNEEIKWNLDLIRKYKDHLDWKFFPYQCSELCTIEFINEFKDYIDFSTISNNLDKTSAPPLPLFSRRDVLDIVEEFEDKLDWGCLSFNWQKDISRESCDRIIEILLA